MTATKFDGPVVLADCDYEVAAGKVYNAGPGDSRNPQVTVVSIDDDGLFAAAAQSQTNSPQRRRNQTSEVSSGRSSDKLSSSAHVLARVATCRRDAAPSPRAP